METRKQYQARYMREYRVNNSSYKEKERKRDREYKKMKRRTDPEWLSRERARRREYGKVSRYRNLAKDFITRKNYLKNPKNILKERARGALRWQVQKGSIKRPDACEICRKTPSPLLDKRAKSGFRNPLRADHHKGYEEENWLNIRWICIDCDGKNLRSKNELVYD